MGKLRKAFYIATCVGFCFAVSMGSMLVTTGLAYAEKQRFIAGQASMIDILDPTLEQLTKIPVSDL